MEMNLELLRVPFPAADIEWRIQSSGVSGDAVWARVLAFITARAIQDRLDEVCGPENWQNDYKPGPQGGVLCGLSIRVNGEWVTKWDGAENTHVEAVKGGLSDAEKRAAVQWGIGRYLYKIGDSWADDITQGMKPGELRKRGYEHIDALPCKAQPAGNWNCPKCKQKHGREFFGWRLPKLPDFALPPEKQVQKAAKASWDAHEPAPDEIPIAEPPVDPRGQEPEETPQGEAAKRHAADPSTIIDGLRRRMRKVGSHADHRECLKAIATNEYLTEDVKDSLREEYIEIWTTKVLPRLEKMTEAKA